MDQRFEALFDAAEKATPGPWHDLSTNAVVRVGLLGEGFNYIARLYMWSHRGHLAARANAAYIAAANPETILSLRDRLVWLEEQLAAVREYVGSHKENDGKL